MRELLNRIEHTEDCFVFEPEGLPFILNSSHLLPADVIDFYANCGGAVLYANAPYPITIVKPNDFELANPIIVGDLIEEDISSHWYIIADDGMSEYLTIDLSGNRYGSCYDSFSDRHGIVGETQIIAKSFTDLLVRLLANKGQRWYWLKSDFVNMGDAYDV